MRLLKKAKKIKKDIRCPGDLQVLFRRKFGKSKNPARPLNLKSCPACDFTRLKKDYQSSSLSSEPDTFVLFRIIGNDLPPSHIKGQSRINLRYILEQEPKLTHCEKRFIVNRIVDAETEAKIIDLLEQSRIPYHHIPFKAQEYAKIGWDDSGIPEAFRPGSPGFKKLHSTEKSLVLMRRYRHKNNYLMNNNGARNRALALGKKLAKWVMPWDGNCFLTESGWNEIISAIMASPEIPYFIVPMARLSDNREVSDPEFSPDPVAEPQILFRRDSTLCFNQSYFYGRRPKVELLWRLGVPGIWDKQSHYPWDLPVPAHADEAGAFKFAGWVARLSTGVQNKPKGKQIRNRAAISMIDRLDRQLGLPS